VLTISSIVSYHCFGEVTEWAQLQDSLLRSQLKIIREFLRQGEEPRLRRHKKGQSQISTIYDMLLNSPNPLHVTEIITRTKQDFSVDLDLFFEIDSFCFLHTNINPDVAPLFAQSDEIRRNTSTWTILAPLKKLIDCSYAIEYN